MEGEIFKKPYQRPRIESEKGKPEASFNCPTTNVKYCGSAYSPKKG